MSGFDAVIGFMFIFFLLLVMVVAVFLGYQKNINLQKTLITKHDYLNSNLKQVNYNITLPFYESGRLNFILKNPNQNKYLKLISEQNNNYCFDFYFNNVFFPKNNFFMNPLRSSAIQYKMIYPSRDGTVSLKVGKLSNLQNGFLKSISCDGLIKYIYVNKSKLNWFNNSFKERLILNVTNPYSKNLHEYQVGFLLNDTNINFYNLKENDIRIEAPITDFLVLDLPFDDYKQTLNDYSHYNNTAYLGYTNLTEAYDPTSDKGVIFNGLNFDGVNDVVTIPNNNRLNPNGSFSVSVWFKDNVITGWQGVITKLSNVNSHTGKGWNIQVGSYNGIASLMANASGSYTYLKAPITPLPNKWYHVVLVHYENNTNRLYVNGVLEATNNFNLVQNTANNLYIGKFYTDASSLYFNGTIDEVKYFDIALNKNQVKDLYENNLRFINLDYYVALNDKLLNRMYLYVKVPNLEAKDSIPIYLFYNYQGFNSLKTQSSMEKVFSYSVPRIVGYVDNDLDSGTIGARITSLYNNNKIIVKNTEYNLNNLSYVKLASSDLILNTSVSAKYLIDPEGNGNAGDIFVPVSWAGTLFSYYGFRATNDHFCMLSPWGSTDVSIRNITGTKWSGVVNNDGICVTLNVKTGNDIIINSTTPILISYYGTSSSGSPQDSFVMRPATTYPLYGVGSNYGYLGNTENTNYISVLGTSGTVQNYVVSSFRTLSFSSGGASGTSPGYKIIPQYPVGAIQQADHDGVESTVFASQLEMSNYFGSSFSLQYLVLVSPYSDADCSVYNSTGAKIGEVVNGVGANGVYKYGFSLNDNLYISGAWYVKCKKKVWGYYEKDAYDDETNLFGYPEMRQFVYPTPFVKIEAEQIN